MSSQISENVRHNYDNNMKGKNISPKPTKITVGLLIHKTT